MLLALVMHYFTCLWIFFFHFNEKYRNGLALQFPIVASIFKYFLSCIHHFGNAIDSIDVIYMFHLIELH